jgi:molecular chaperone Hsp33
MLCVVDDTLKNVLIKEMQNYWVKAISLQGGIKAIVLDVRKVVNELSLKQELSQRAQQGLSEAVVGGLLLSSYCKGREKINLNIQGAGYYKQALVDAYPNATFRGYLIENEFHQEQQLPWGEGVLSVLRTKEEDHQPYIGTVPLLTGQLAKDLTYYWMQSEQVLSAVGIQGGRGFMIQTLPQAQEEEIVAVEEALKKHIFDDSLEVRGFLTKIFNELPFQILEEKEVKFECHCSLQKVEKAILLVGEQEIQAIIQEQGQAHIQCDFCHQDYDLSQERLLELIQEIKKSTLN